MPSAATSTARVDAVVSNTARFDSARKQRLVCSLVLAVAILIFFNPVARNGFVFFDDSVYLIKNNSIRNGIWDTVRWSFTTFHAGNWHPLTWLSHALDYQLFGMNPAGHHYVGLLFHASNAVLVFLILESATGLLWPSLIVAAIFGLHPLSVESVAWAAERKNLLSMFFCLLALWSYTKHARSGKKSDYLTSIICFAFGLMAKPQIISLPALLCLWDYWPLGRLRFDHRADGKISTPSLRSLATEKIPFFALALLSAIVTVVAQRSGNAVRSLAEMPVLVRVENSLVAYAGYIAKFFWPEKLAPMYPHPGSSLAVWQVALAGVALAAITACVLWQRDRRFLLVGWLWFLIPLVPMIGLVQVGEQAMADRYMYLSILGLLIAVIWGMREIILKFRIPSVAWAVPSVAVTLVLGGLTYHQLSYWHDGETLWRYTLSVTKRNYMAHDNLAMVLAEQGRSDEAIIEFRAAEDLHQYSAPEIISLGAYEQSHGHLEGAIEQYVRAAQDSTQPAIKAAAWARAGAAQVEGSRFDLARRMYESALAANPGDPDALAGSAMLAQRSGDSALALQRLDQLVRVAPGDVSFLLLAGALHQAGRADEAQKLERQAQQISTNYQQAQTTARQFAAQFGVSQ